MEAIELYKQFFILGEDLDSYTIVGTSNMTSDERKRFAYGNNAATYFTHITIDTELLKKVKPRR
jgi:hypothetical protein